MQRITNNMMVNDLIRTLNERMRSLNDLQQQLSSGKQVFYASDDPAAAGLILELRSHLSQNSQFQENVQSGVNWLGSTESVIQQLNDILTQARADAVEGSNSALGAEAMADLANEVDSYLENIFALANDQYSGKYMFGGTNTNTSPFIATRDPVTDQITAIIANPDGTTGSVMRQVGSSESIQINIAGAELFQPDGSGGSEDMFQVLINLRNALQAGDVDLVGETITQIDTVMDTTSAFASLAGSRVTRLTNLQSSLLFKETALTGQLSEKEDADLVELMTDMTLEQNAYQVALNVGSMVIQPSLADFL
ncbi:flagellar hook-associated protein 3 [candidate division LCP-89 bacterium B3_LCP]|uniref:Flagellar hook-associated protein 3 n=1 Tax=candidate division LCP-89 bacterium B3_LCP TaxID=2012998 RepID=A0A532UZC9_UNCL8|nr:MAG: flagellar hook-associated protein 3 [candidate division LCP-89 bacterium B3_LCP]